MTSSSTGIKQNSKQYPYTIEQTWWHISDTYHPYPSHHFRQVMDIILFNNTGLPDENKYPILDIDLPPNSSSFRVYARNIGKEIAFILPSQQITDSDVFDDNESKPVHLHLPRYSEFPSFTRINPGSKNEKGYHLKLEIEYEKSDGEIGTRPSIQSRKKSLIDNRTVIVQEQGIICYYWRRFTDFIRPKMESSITIPGLIVPEFSITLPKGWELETPLIDRFNAAVRGNNRNGLSNIELSVNWILDSKKINDSMEFISFWNKMFKEHDFLLEEYLRDSLLIPINYDTIFLLGEPNFENINGRYKYVYIMDDNSNEKYIRMMNNYRLVSSYLEDDDSNTTIQQINTLQYNAELTTIAVVLSFWIPIVFSLGSLVGMILTITGFIHFSPENGSPWALLISFLVAYAAYLYTFFSYKKEGYNIPSNKVLASVLFMVVVLVFTVVFACVNT